MVFRVPKFEFLWSRKASTAAAAQEMSQRRQQAGPPTGTTATTTAAQRTAQSQQRLNAVVAEADATRTSLTRTSHESEDTNEISASIHRSGKPPRGYKSYTLTREVEKPWLKDPRWHRPRQINNMIMITGCILSFIISFFLVYDGYWSSLPAGKYCLIMDDQFEAIDHDNWSYETQTGGFEHGEFSWATADSSNIFTDAEGLHIVPTLTTESTDITESQLIDGYTVNLTSSRGWGSCTSSDVRMCSVRSNATLGRIIPPVRSARITTKGKKSIRYGRVEVVAKMPKGDWLWPAIWMMPEDSAYGAWPASGEIDIAELRGNDRKYPRGRNLVTSTLHFGPDPQHDGSRETYDTLFFEASTDFSDKFFTYGFEWYQDYMFMHVDHKRIFSIRFKGKETFWDRGKFQGMASKNGTMSHNPWREAGNTIAPFDQKFYLNLKVAVGAQHGYFYDGKFNKPWVDGTPLAAREFWNAREQWLPTWGNGTDRGMTVKSVKMWQQCE